MQVSILRNCRHKDHVQTGAEALAAAKAARERRMAMFAPIQPIDPEPKPEPEPIEIPKIPLTTRWNGWNWVGDFPTLVAAAYPQAYGPAVRSVAAVRPTVEQIIKTVSRISGFSVSDIISERRTFPLIEPRHTAMALCKHFTLRSLPEIGRRFGDRDHTTVLNAIKKMEPIITAVKASLPKDATIHDWASATLTMVKNYKFPPRHRNTPMAQAGAE